MSYVSWYLSIRSPEHTPEHMPDSTGTLLQDRRSLNKRLFYVNDCQNIISTYCSAIIPDNMEKSNSPYSLCKCTQKDGQNTSGSATIKARRIMMGSLSLFFIDTTKKRYLYRSYVTL